MESKGSEHLSPTSSCHQKNGSGKEHIAGKVALKPGHSLMDWIRLSRSAQDLANVGGQMLTVTMPELKQHNAHDDAWTAIRGRVYNITPYMDYHPGGETELMRCAGIDGTLLFNEVHKWVNAESMLEKCFVGPLLLTNSMSKGGADKFSKHSMLQLKCPSYKWLQCSNFVTIVICCPWKAIQTDCVTIDKLSKVLRIAVCIDEHIFKIHRELENDVTTEYNVRANDNSSQVEVVLQKVEPNKHWSFLGKRLRGDNSYIATGQAELVYRKCKVLSVSALTHDTILLAIAMPDGCRAPVPIGHHIQIKHNVECMEVTRSYTPVLPSLIEQLPNWQVQEGRVMYLMFKVYLDGVVTPCIGSLCQGDPVLISDSNGSFSLSRLAGITHLVLFAAGTGLTPMLRLLHHILFVSPSLSVLVHLLFYSKKVCDIIWHRQLDELAHNITRFQVTHILSDEPSYAGLHGRVCISHIRQFVPMPEGGDTSVSHCLNEYNAVKPLVCVCGPTGFTRSTSLLLTEAGLSEAHYFLFEG